MVKKLTDEVVKELAGKRGYIPLTSYVNNSSTMSFKCSHGHIWRVSWQIFRVNECKHCAKEIENKKYMEEAIGIIESAGGKYISGEYIRKESRIRFNCICGNEGNLMLVELRRSEGCCPNCRYERSSEKLSLPYEHVKSVFEDNGCELISDKYINSSKKLKFRCSCGTVDEKDFTCFKACPRCSECVGRDLSLPVRPKMTLEEAIELFEDNDCKLISYDGEFNGAQTIVSYRCRCGRPHSSSVSQFRQALRCRQCGIEETAKKNRYTINDVRKFVKENSDCVLVSESVNKTTDILDFICRCGNPFDTTFSYFKHENKRHCDDCGLALRSGENAPRWKGGITSETEKIRHSKEYALWRNNVFERDNYTCQCCLDNSGGNLQAHHIENFSTNEDLRFEISNGLTMCNTCHDFRYFGAFHHKYGTRENTKEQLIEYITEKRQELGISAEMPFLLRS